MLIGLTEDGDECDLISYEIYNNDDEEDVDYSDESDGVQEDLEEFDDILGNETDADNGQDHFESNEEDETDCFEYDDLLDCSKCRRSYKKFISSSIFY